MLRANRCGAIVYCPCVRPGDGHTLIERTLHGGGALLNCRGLPVAGSGAVHAVVARSMLEALAAPAVCAEPVGIHFAQGFTSWTVDVSNRHLSGPLRPRLADRGDGRLQATQTVGTGPVTALALVEPAPGMLMPQFAEGMVVDGPERGNDGHCRIVFDDSMDHCIGDWRSMGAGGRCAIGAGHVGSALQRLARYLNLNSTSNVSP
jgi:hypothetical protein